MDNLNNLEIEKSKLIIEKNNGIETEQKNFLETALGKTINAALNVGLRLVLPDMIENQVIEIKDTLLQNGLKEGIQKGVQSAIDFGKSILGIATGKFDNIEQVQTAVSKGGILDNISTAIDYVLNKTVSSGKINKEVSSVIKSGKNVIIDNISKNIENMLVDQIKSVEKLNKYSVNWNTYYQNQDFTNMEREYNKIKTEIKNIVPLENTIKAVRQIENIHTVIKNNGQNFNLTEEQLKLAQKLV